ncbi:MAG TPA: hypothetical protein DEB39_12235 [Planctomycetaceae bacterium]|nr:hypothetical protein [Planctomycetaceae bacterium]
MMPMRALHIIIAVLSGVGLLSAQSPLRNPQADPVTRGIEAARKGDIEAASRCFRDAMEDSPGTAPAGLQAAAAFSREPYGPGRFGKVRFWIEKTAVDYPDDPEAFLLLAEIAAKEGRLIEAQLLLKHAESLIEKKSDEKTGNPADAEKEARAGTKENGDVSGRFRTLRGRARILHVTIAESQKNWSEAVKLLETIIADWPEHTDLLLRLGRDQFKGGEREKGIETLRKSFQAKEDAGSIGKGTTHSDAAGRAARLLLPLIVDLYEQEGLMEDAKAYLALSLEEEPKNPQVLIQAAELEIKWNDLEAAGKLADRAGESLQSDKPDKPDKSDKSDGANPAAEPPDPSLRNPMYQRLQGVLALYANDYPKAERHFNLVQSLHPNDPMTLSGLILALCEQGDSLKLRRAQRLANDYYRAAPDSADAAASLALVAMRNGNFPLARKLLEEKFDEGEIGAVGAFYLALVLEREGQRDEAILFLKSGLETPTNFPLRTEAEQMLKRLTEH